MNDPLYPLWYISDSALGVLLALILSLSPWLARRLRAGGAPGMSRLWTGFLLLWWVGGLALAAVRARGVRGSAAADTSCFNQDWFDSEGPVRCFDAPLHGLQLASTASLLVLHALLFALLLRRAGRPIPGALLVLGIGALATAISVGWVYRTEELLLAEGALRWHVGLLGAGMTGPAIVATLVAVPFALGQVGVIAIHRRWVG